MWEVEVGGGGTLTLPSAHPLQQLLNPADAIKSQPLFLNVLGDCEETPDIPAYQNENRFDSLDFPWLEITRELELCGQNTNISSSCSSLSECDEQTYSELIQGKKILLKGVLSTQDILCMKYIGELSSDATLHWFISFLMHKDLQSNYNFLKSCLVTDVLSEKNGTIEVGSDLKNYKYDIILKV